MGLKQSLPRCVAIAKKDGTRCGRRARPGSNPQLCHLHDGSTITPFTRDPSEFEPHEILQKLMRDPNPQIRLRAVDLLLSLKNDRTCPTCASRESSEASSARLIAYANTEQCDELRTLTARIATIKEQILMFIAAGGTAFAPPVVEQADSDEPVVDLETPDPPPAPPAMVQVWRNGQLVEEPRANRKWQRVEDL